MNKQQLKEHLLFFIWALCDHEDRSTEYMIALMINMTGADHDEVIDFITTRSDDRSDWYKKNPNWLTELEES